MMQVLKVIGAGVGAIILGPVIAGVVSGLTGVYISELTIITTVITWVTLMSVMSR